MVATAPGENFFIGRLHPPYYSLSGLFLCRKLHLFLGKSNQQNLLPPELHFLTPIRTKSFVGWDFSPDPTVGAFSAPPGPVAVFRGLFLKGGEGEKRKGGRREEWEIRRG